MQYVYILESKSDNDLYISCTNNLKIDSNCIIPERYYQQTKEVHSNWYITKCF